MKYATDAMKESRIYNFLASFNALQYRRMDFEEFSAAVLSVHQLEALERWEQHARCAYEMFEKQGYRTIMIEELASDTKERMAGVERLHQHLEASRKSLSTSEVTSLVDACLDLFKDNNFRVAQGALQALASAAVLSGDHLKLHFNAIVPAVVERLGDAKQPVRDAARRLLTTLMEILQMLGDPNPAVREAAIPCIEVFKLSGRVHFVLPMDEI